MAQKGVLGSLCGTSHAWAPVAYTGGTQSVAGYRWVWREEVRWAADKPDWIWLVNGNLKTHQREKTFHGREKGREAVFVSGSHRPWESENSSLYSLFFQSITWDFSHSPGTIIDTIISWWAQLTQPPAWNSILISVQLESCAGNFSPQKWPFH